MSANFVSALAFIILTTVFPPRILLSVFSRYAPPDIYGRILLCASESSFVFTLSIVSVCPPT